MGIINVFITSISRPGEGSSTSNLNSYKKSRIYLTPFRHQINILLVKAHVKKTRLPLSEVKSVSKESNVRCLDCGWKYNFNQANNCPNCLSEKTYLLSNGSFFSGFLVSLTSFSVFLILIILGFKNTFG